jgi:hypothetical protein
MIALASDTQFGLNNEQYEYARRLAHEAANGAWAGSSAIVKASAAFLRGDLELTAQRLLIAELLRLAAEDPDHSWEAPILTGYPAAYAVAALDKVNGAATMLEEGAE